jgi:hypothetical protein
VVFPFLRACLLQLSSQAHKNRQGIHGAVHAQSLVACGTRGLPAAAQCQWPEHLPPANWNPCKKGVRSLGPGRPLYGMEAERTGIRILHSHRRVHGLHSGPSVSVGALIVEDLDPVHRDGHLRIRVLRSWEANSWGTANSQGNSECEYCSSATALERKIIELYHCTVLPGLNPETPLNG